MSWDFPEETPVVKIGTLVIDFDRYTLTVDGHPVNITPKEMQCLAALAHARGRTLTYGWLEDVIWEGHETEPRNLKELVHRLRTKLGPEKKRLKTIWQIGYRLDCD
jgi:DNA-binding response OmpR family regulator